MSKVDEKTSRGSSNYFNQKAGEDLDVYSQFGSSEDNVELRDDLKQDLETKLTSWSTFIFFLKHSFRDIGRRKFHFFLAFCSVLIVVLSTLVVNTVIQKGPIIFMKLAQTESGEIDCIYSPTGRQQNSNDYWYPAWSMNYTQAINVLDENKVEHHLAPRMQMCPPDDAIMFSDYKGELLAANGTMCLKFIDTD